MHTCRSTSSASRKASCSGVASPTTSSSLHTQQLKTGVLLLLALLKSSTATLERCSCWLC